MKNKGEPMPEHFHLLATFNAEVARGIVHTPEWEGLMAKIQLEYDRWMRSDLERRGYTIIQVDASGRPMVWEKIE